jgi:hypothetical protein
MGTEMTMGWKNEKELGRSTELNKERNKIYNFIL